MKLHDFMIMIGLLLILIGLWLVSIPLALCVTGSGLIVIGIIAAKVNSKLPDKPKEKKNTE